jgi:replicative DNA helicase
MTQLHSEQAELAVLGTVLLNNGAMDALCNLEPKHFSNARLGEVWGAMLSLYATNEPIEEASVHIRLGKPPWGVSVLQNLDTKGGTVRRAESYAKTVIDAFVRRQIVAGCNDTAQLAQSPDIDATALVEQVQNMVSDAITSGFVDEPTHIKKVLQDNWNELQKGPENTTMLATGIRTIDDFTGGLARGQVTIIAARPSMGKSSMAVNLIANMGRAGRHILFTSMEDTAHFVGIRMIARAAGVRSTKLVHCDVTLDDYNAIQSGMNALAGCPIWIDDKPGRTVTNIKYTATMLQKRRGLDVLVIDHLGELTNDEKSYSSTSTNIRGLRDIAKDLNIPVVVLCQLNRAKEQDADKRPTLANLRDSGRIEEVARAVWFLHREYYYDKTKYEGTMEMIVAKATHGKTGTLELAVDFDHMAIGDASY